MLAHLERQSRLTPNQKRIVFAGGPADILNFYDYYLIGFALAFIVSS
jgi:putative MFS transporter